MSTYLIADIQFVKGAKNAWRKGEYQKAINILEPYAQKGITRALILLAAIYVDAPIQIRNYAKAEKYYKLAVNQGDPIAMRELAFLYMSTRRFHEAMELFNRIAKYNDKITLESMVYMYCGVYHPYFKRDLYQCAYWIKRAKSVGISDPYFAKFWREYKLWNYE